MFSQPSTRLTGGVLPDSYSEKVDTLLNEFAEAVIRIFERRQIRRPAFIRSMLSGSTYIILCDISLFAVGQVQFGMPTTLYTYLINTKMDSYQAFEWVRWEFGVEEGFIISFPREILDQTIDERKSIVWAIAESHVEAELQRSLKIMNLVPINPIFGAASYAVDERLAFVLMPFKEDLTRIYQDIVKPTVQQAGLVCHRADDYKTNKVVIQDIWKAICEARVVLADMTGLNANVMYELGVAHTVGKETILIYQVGKNRTRNPKEKFPFDLNHIRRIEYENDASGGQKLARELAETLQSILKPSTLS